MGSGDAFGWGIGDWYQLTTAGERAAKPSETPSDEVFWEVLCQWWNEVRLFETEQPEDYKIMSALVTTLSVVLANATAAAGSAEPAIPATAAAALAVGLAALGAGYAERGIGSAAVGATAEDGDMFGRGLILTVLPETLVILALVVVFLTL